MLRRASLREAKQSLSRDDYRRVLYARTANGNTIAGGASAMVRAEYAEKFDGGEAASVMSQVYSRSSGRVPDHLDAWHCPECGSVHYGADSAYACCAPWDDDDSY